MSKNGILQMILYFPRKMFFSEKSFYWGKNFNVSTNNIICVQDAKVIWNVTCPMIGPSFIVNILLGLFGMRRISQTQAFRVGDYLNPSTNWICVANSKGTNSLALQSYKP
jgi:hypothetical protein